MAHIFRPTYTKVIPNENPTLKVSGRNVSWVGRKGDRVVATICENDSDRCRVTSKVWHIRYTDEKHIPRTVAAFTDKASSERKMVDIVRQVERLLRGEISEQQAARADKSLGDMIEMWRADMLARAVTERFATMVANRVKRLCRECGVRQAQQLNPGLVARTLAEMRTAGTSVQTSNHYQTNLRTFVTWSINNHLLDGDPLKGSKSIVMGGRQTFERRALTRDEIDRLILQVGNRNKRLVGMSGPDRQALYACAIYSGMRVGELASLTRASFHLDNDPPYLTVRAGNTKSKKQRDIPVPAEIANLLRAWLETRPPVGNVWPQTNWTRGGAGVMLRRDLIACGIAEETVGTSPAFARDAISTRNGPTVAKIDFHALRTTYATILATSGVPIQHAQRLLGHSSPILTMKHYTKLTIDDLGDQVCKIEVKPVPEGSRRSQK